MSNMIVAKLFDKPLLSLFSEAASLVDGTISLKIFGHPTDIDLETAYELLANSGETTRNISQLNFSKRETNSQGYTTELTINLFRSHAELKSPFHDYLVTSGNLLNLQTTVVLFSLLDKGLSPQIQPTSDQNHLAQLLDGTIKTSHDQLTNLMTQITSGLADDRRQMESDFVKKVAELEKGIREREKALATEFVSKSAKLEEKELALEAEKSRLDDRSSTHARRQLRENLKRDIEARTADFSVTDETKGLRRPIHLACIFGLCSLAVAIAITTYLAVGILDKQVSTVVLILSLTKPFGLTIAFLGLLAYYIRWLNRWFDKHAEAEFQLRQFSLDIDRASWVVESSLEWRRDGAGEIPEELLNSITRNLFAYPNEDKDEMHPADYLASALVGNAQHLKLALGGAELDLRGKDIRKISPIKAGG